jgi:hypothetical protein
MMSNFQLELSNSLITGGGYGITSFSTFWFQKLGGTALVQVTIFTARYWQPPAVLPACDRIATHAVPSIATHVVTSIQRQLQGDCQYLTVKTASNTEVVSA